MESDSRADSFRESVEQMCTGDPEGIFNAAVDLAEIEKERALEILYTLAAQRGVIDAWLNLAYVVTDSGRVEEGFLLLRESAIAGDPKGAFMYAQELEERSEFSEAEFWYARAGAIPGAPARRARALRALGRDAEALAVLRAAAPEDAEAAIDLVEADSALGLDAAIDLLQRHRAKGASEVLIPLSLLCERRGDFDLATQLLRESVALGEKNASFNLGLTLVQRGQVEEGVRFIRDAAAGGDELASRWLGGHPQRDASS
ncbi:hypothetical protein [Cellulomonas dongxiuzhuiae]|uniref:hypothetical protein n=1 Tax=Cellulomonas dongxiuzhuiae TaxID=2819979 RepID=UPI001AAFF310|nr:hypothetical protein [Cellulomonas dongxiuzhuiae]MBO3088974.1 hypothetical protein [Cellulomonas dongxiuzhuiae]